LSAIVRRTITNLAGGSFEGPCLREKILPGGGDWFLVNGKDVINEKVAAAITKGGAAKLGDTYFMTQLRFETGDARYGWLNRLRGVAEGRLRSGGVEYRVFELVNG
jgi:hypothetical protein